MLQAAVAQPAALAVQPDNLVFMVDPTDLSVPQAQINLLSPASSTWTAVSSATWLTVTPSSGAMTTQPAISVVKNSLSDGRQQGNVTFTTNDGFSEQVTVSAYLGTVMRTYLPVIAR